MTFPGTLQWDYERYADKLSPALDLASDEREGSLRLQHPPLNISINQPCLVVDIHGTVVAALFPSVLSEERQVSVPRSIICLLVDGNVGEAEELCTSTA